jgi:hypothetical protein
MLARATLRTTSAATSQLVARRAFTTTRARLSSPYHYPEGPLSNLPFNPRKKGFAFWYWSFMATGFGLPFGVCGTFSFLIWRSILWVVFWRGEWRVGAHGVVMVGGNPGE